MATSGRRSWLERLTQGGWTAADRCALVSAIILGSVIVFTGAMFVAAGWPYLRTGAEPAARLFGELSLLAVLGWSALLVLSLVARKRAPKSRLLVHATVQAYGVSIGAFTVLTGPFYGPGWIAFLGGAMVGFLLFGRRPTVLGSGTFLVVVGGGAAVLHEDLIPELTRLARISGGLDGASSWGRLGLSSVTLAAFVLVITDRVIARWRWHADELERLSRTDSLTGLTNRRRFLSILERELQRASRYGRPLSLVLVDVDHFKSINDTHGHPAGDQVLVEVARVLREAVRDLDAVARVGGEEFALLLPDTPREGAVEVASRCLRLVEGTPVVTGGATIPVTASFGVATFPAEGLTRLEDLVRLADEALYRAKREGRNRVIAA